MATCGDNGDQFELAEVRAPRNDGTPSDKGIEAREDRTNKPSAEGCSPAKTSHPGPSHGLVYGLEDTPRWHITLFLGLQLFVANFGSNITTTFILAPFFCISHDAVIVGELIGTLFVVTGLATVLQTTFGVRLPIVQGTSFAFMLPTFSILNLRGDCPPVPTENSTAEEISEVEDEWLARIREIQGAIMVASCVQVLIGVSGIVGALLRFIGPLAVAPTITLIGLSLQKVVADKAGLHWGVSFITMALIILFSQFLPEISVPVLSYSSQKKCHVIKFKLFKLFPIILGIVVGWVFCLIFTATGVFPDDLGEYGYAARTDLNVMALERSAWFRFPYPGQWGIPTVNMSNVLGIVTGVLVSIVESIGDYYACARMTGAPPPPQHAINRGILMEGIGCILSGAWGAVTGLTSHSHNIGTIGLTKVGSRVVFQTAGCFMIAIGCIGKIGALFTTIPQPVIGGVLCVTIGILTAVGISNLQFVDLSSSRNLFVLGFPILMGVVVPYYMENNPDSLKTGSTEFDQVVTVMLKTGMFVGGFLGILLDNTVPGTDKERGLVDWHHQTTSDVKDDERGSADAGAAKEEERDTDSAGEEDVRLTETNEDDLREAKTIGPSTNPPSPACYDLPFGMRFIRRWAWCRYLPFSPTFKGFRLRKLKICKRNR